MSEPVYHNLSIFHPVNSTPAVEWVTAHLEQTRHWDLSVTHAPSELLRGGSLGFISFVTPWEPQLALILEASRQFPDTQFQLGFFGSAGTVLEDTACFTLRDGAILTFESGPCGVLPFETEPCDAMPLPLDKMFFEVLDYCGKYAGGSSPMVRGVMALCLDKGMKIRDANEREVTHDSLAVDELTSPQKQWAGICSQEFAKTVMMYSVPSIRTVEAYLKQTQ
jgi:hypothetical protein